MAEKILLVDDDENVLHGYHRNLRAQFSLEVALGGVQALQALEQHGPFAVLVADMNMPGMTGMEVLRQAQDHYPETIRIMLTGNSDQKTAMDAVNEGRVFRFLTKPCPAQYLSRALQAGIRQHQLECAEKELLEKTLTGSIQVLSDLLGTLAPATFSRCQRVRRRCIQVGRVLGCQGTWALEVAALLAPIGRLALPQEILQGEGSKASLRPLLSRIPEIGARLLNPIPRMEEVAAIIRYQAKGYDGSGAPADEVEGEALPLGARILKVVWDFTELVEGRQSRAVAMEALRLLPKAYDPRVLDALESCLPLFSTQADMPETCLTANLRPGMVLASEIRSSQGQLMYPKGLCLGVAQIELFRNLVELQVLEDPIVVFPPEVALP